MNERDDLPRPQDGRPSYEPAPRIGDAEREQAVQALSEHYAAGRIDRSELDARLETAYRARTLDQLRALFADLPEPAPFRPDPKVVRREQRALARRTAVGRVPVFPLLLLVLLVVVLATGGKGFFLLPVMWFGFAAVGRGRPHHRG